MNGSLRPGAVTIVRFAHLSILAFLATAILFCGTPNSHAQTADRTKIAEGEYLIHTNNPYDKQEVVREPWVLWRIGDGRYLVEGELRFEKTGHEPEIIDQTVILTREFRPLEMKTIGHSSNPGYQVDIQIADDEIRVTNPKGHLTKRLTSSRDFYDPASQWTWSGLARRAPPVKGLGRPLEFSIVDIDGPDAVIGIGESWGRIQCLGAEQLETAGQKFSATKYVLHLGMFPGLFLWLSEDGLVLASQNEEDAAQATELVKLTRYEDLPKLVDRNASKTPKPKP